MLKEKLGRYIIEDVLGEGAMGLVYRARDPLLERTVALKTIRLDLTEADRSTFNERFLHEAKSAGRLNHPGIVTVYDAGEIDNTAYISMEHLQGQDLRSLIRKEKQLPPEQVADLVAQIAEALDYAHEQGVIHRDIKPGNIMLLPDGKAKLMDFGIARLQASSMTQTGMTVGTPKYMSPEVITGQKVDGRSDIYSLGVVLYHLLTGHVPFDGDTVTTLMYRVMKEPAPHPVDQGVAITPGFEYILNRALAKDPTKRYSRASKMARDLHRVHKYKKEEGILFAGGLATPRHRNYAAPEIGRPQRAAQNDVLPLDKVTSPKVIEPELMAAKSNLVPRDPIPPLVQGGNAAVLDDSRSATFVLSSQNLHWLAWLGMFAVGIGSLWYIIQSSLPKHSNKPATSHSLPVSASPTTNEQAKFAQPSSSNHAPNQASNQPTVKQASTQTSIADLTPAKLLVAVAPWGEIRVDGVSMGVSPPLSEISLQPGTRQIEIINGNLPAYRQVIELEAGQELKIKHQF